jgi:hypothetical protein
MGDLIKSPPKELGRDPVAMLLRIQQEALNLSDEKIIHQRYLLVDLAKKWAGQFGTAGDEIIRESTAGRLMLERSLGQVLNGTVKAGSPIVIGDDNWKLPEWVSRNLSSAAQLLAKAPKRWFDRVIEEIKNGTRRPNLMEVYLEAKRVVAGMKAGPKPAKEAEGIILGDFREVGSQIADESATLVFTDPPYDRDSVGLYEDVAEFAARVLLPGGSLIVYAPNYLLPTVLDLGGKHLRYWWTLACVLPNDHALMREYGLRVGWKPLLWFTKGGRFNKQEIIEDTILGAAKEKTEHEWQQQELEACELIDKLTVKNDLVVDPMCGSGTTLAAAKALGRRWMGIEIKPDTAELARDRLRLDSDRLLKDNGKRDGAN